MSTISSSTTTTTGYVVTSDTTGTLVIQTGATPTTAVTVNGSGALGVGSSPSYGTSGQVLTSAGSSATPTWAAGGASLTTPSFTTTIGVGAATAASTGAGVTFPATQSQSSDANTLDDYEEGTWSPTITDGYTRTYSGSTTGRYVKVGKMVYMWGQLQGSTKSGTANAYGWINLPFPANNMPQISSYTTICEPYGITHTNSVITVAPQWDAPSTGIIKNTTVSGNVSYLDPTNIATNFELGFFLVIWTNS